MTLTKRERFNSILSGQLADRPIVSSWNHFVHHEHSAEDLAKTTVEFAKKYGWDWIKVNPRATYLAEAWGNTYDFSDYEDVFPKQIKCAVQSSAEFTNVPKIDVKASRPFREQLETLSLIKQGIPEVPIIQTIFSPLSVLCFLSGISPYYGSKLYGSRTELEMPQMLAENPDGAKRALRNIAETLSDYIREIEKTGADGIFYAVTGTANTHFLSEDDFEEFSRPYDLQVLKAIKTGKIVLHTCGDYARPEYFDAFYPIDGISWDVIAQHNAGIDVPMLHVKVGGIHHGYFTEKDKEKALANASYAVSENKKKPFILGPDCTVPENAPEDLLKTIKSLV